MLCPPGRSGNGIFKKFPCRKRRAALQFIRSIQITTVASACPLCGSHTIPRDGDYLVGGTIAIVTGALAILGGIPLVYFGAKHKRTGVWLTAGGLSGSF